MMNVMPIMAGGIGAGQGPSYSSTPVSPGEQKKQLTFEEWRKRRQKARAAWEQEPLTIDKLTPYSLSQVTQSLNKYLYGGNSKKEGNAWSTGMGARFSQQGMDYNNRGRSEYQRGSYGVEDEFRRMIDNGWEGERRAFGGGFDFDMGIDEEGEEATPPGKKPGDEGYSYDPSNNYYGTEGSGLPGQPGQQGQQSQQGKPPGTYDYSGYDPAEISKNIRKTGQISTGFYNKAYGQSVEQGQAGFGVADLEGNMAAGITGTQLKEYFDRGGAAALGAKQGKGTGGIYDQVAALAATEEEVELEELPGAKSPPPMNIAPATVGNVGNASGVRAKRSNSSRSGRNARGTSQFNRNSFNNRKTSSLTIGGLNI